jgi:ribonuclease J
LTSPLRFTPLGGLGEIGMNCMALEHEGSCIVLDCGVTFDDRGLGVDVVHADLTYLAEREDRVEAIVLTHGHEDHIGAVAFLLAAVDVPVYGPPYAIALVRERLAEGQRGRPASQPRLHEIRPGDRVHLGPFEVEPFRVTHSMPDCCGLILRTPQGVVVHSGDFKIEDDPTDGETFDLERLRAVRDAEGPIRLLLSDSTNSFAEGRSGGEREVAQHLLEVVRSAENRVVVSLFASNVHRIRALVHVALETDRRLCLLGRSLDTHGRIGEAQGYLDDLARVRIPRDEARHLPPERLLVGATGTQGEPRAALARLAADTHPDLSLAAGDLVIHSARLIPGNEKNVYDMLNTLERRGIETVWRALDAGVHASGHAFRGEQRILLDAVRPESFLPVHGTFMHLKRHAEVARECGVEDVVVVENGTPVELDEAGLSIGERFEVPRVHRSRGETVDPLVLKDRRLLAELGVAVVTILADDEGRPTGDVDILTRGVVHEDENQELLDDACDYVFKAMKRARYRVDRPTDDDLELEARRALKRFMGRRLGRRPLCYAVVLRTSG